MIAADHARRPRSDIGLGHDSDLALGADFAQLERVVQRIYGLPNDRWFDLGDMAMNVTRFTLRGIKAVRKLASGNKSDSASARANRAATDLAIAVSWFASTGNRLHLSLDDCVWDRFPYRCYHCQAAPCRCPRRFISPDRPRPQSIEGFQEMFEVIYPWRRRSLEVAALHLAEEVGEFGEALLMYRTRHRAMDLRQVRVEAADYLSCVFGVFNSLERNCADEMRKLFRDGCHVCHSTPCRCSFNRVLDYNLDDKW